MKVKIGELASRIWKILQKEGKIEIDQLKKKVLDEMTFQNQEGRYIGFFSSLGWLLKEGKIEMKEAGEKIFIIPK